MLLNLNLWEENEWNSSNKNLQKVFCKGNICIAENISLSINEGEIFTILGKSGSGKTTFFKNDWDLKLQMVEKFYW